MKKFLLAATVYLGLLTGALAQSTPGLYQNQVPTPGQWNSFFAAKQDVLGYLPLPLTGGVMTGQLTTTPSTANTSGFNLAPGAAPTSPVNGDIWETATGIFARVNSITVPITGASSASFGATSPITVTFPSGVVTYACATCGVVGSPLSQFASTSSAQLRSIMSDPTGSGGGLVFATAPTIASPIITTSFTATGLVGLPNLASQSANTVVGAAGAGSPVALAVPGCTGSANALQWTTGTGFNCGVITSAAASVAVGTTTITGGSAGNIFYHNGTLLGELTTSGSGTAVALTVSPVLTTPNIGAATATTINGNTWTAGTGTLTIAAAKTLVASNSLTLAGVDGKTLTLNNSITFAGTDGTTFTFPTSSDTLMGVNAVQTLTNKTLTSPIMTNPTLGTAVATSLAINGATIGTNGLAITGTAAISGALSSGTFSSSGSISATGADANFSAGGNRAFMDTAGATSRIGSLNGGGTAIGLAIVVNGATQLNFASGGALTVSPAMTLSSALTYGGVTLSNAVTGTGNMVLSANPTLTGTLTAATANLSGAVAITQSAANALAVGLNGATNPAFVVDASTALQAAGLSVKGAVTGGTVALAAIDSGANTNLSIDAKGTGTITLGGTSTGGITLTRAATLSAALTYGGVTLSNAVTGTGNMVLSANPTITGHATIEGVTATGATGAGNFVFASNPSIGNLTVTGAFTSTGLVTYADMATAAIATQSNYFSGAANTLVPASQIYQPEITVTYSATPTLDFNTFINAAITLTGNITTQTVSNATAGKGGTITFVQDATGSRTTVWNSVFKFSGGVAPALSTTANAVDVLAYNCRSATNCPATLIKDVR